MSMYRLNHIHHNQLSKGVTMFRNSCRKNYVFLMGALVLCFGLLCQGALADPPYAAIYNVEVSPNLAGNSDLDDFDVISPGINTVGVGKTLYLAPALIEDAPATLTFVWDVEPNDESELTILVENDDLLKITPLVEGEFTVTLTPMDGDTATTPSELTLWVAGYVGAQGCTGCHGSIGTIWGETKHATFMQRLLDEDVTTHYGTYCLDCHNVGTYQNTEGDDNFFEAVADEDDGETSPTLLDQIVIWVNNGSTEVNFALVATNPPLPKYPTRIRFPSMKYTTHPSPMVRVAPPEISISLETR